MASRARDDFDRFIAALDAKYVRSPIQDSWWMGHGYVGCRINRRRQCIDLIDLWVEQRFRQCGYGGDMLKVVTKLADRFGLKMITYVKPFDAGTDRRRTAKELTAWYGRMGFLPIGGGDLLRRPK